jgi:hypothetical protein
MAIREWDEEPTGYGNEEAGWQQLTATRQPRARPAGYQKMATQGSKRQKKEEERPETGTQNGRTCNSCSCLRSILCLLLYFGGENGYFFLHMISTVGDRLMTHL